MGSAEGAAVEHCLSCQGDAGKSGPFFSEFRTELNRRGRGEVSLRLCLHW